MKQQVNMITLGVRDLRASREFYEKVVGWTPLPSRPSIEFFQLGGLVLALVLNGKLAKEQHITEKSGGGAFQRVLFSHLVATREDVDAIHRRLASGGADIPVPPEAIRWGGYSFTFADPDGHRWRVICHPHWTVEEDGSLAMPEY